MDLWYLKPLGAEEPLHGVSEGQRRGVGLLCWLQLLAVRVQLLMVPLGDGVVTVPHRSEEPQKTMRHCAWVAQHSHKNSAGWI